MVRRAGKGGGHALPAVRGGVDVSWAGGPSLSEVQVLVDVLGEEVGHEPGQQLNQTVAPGSSRQVGECHGVQESRGLRILKSWCCPSEYRGPLPELYT